MADADKAEVPGAAGRDSPQQQPAEPPAEPRREPPPPETEKQPQLSSGSSSSANGVKMYCLFLGGRGEVGAQGGLGPGPAGLGLAGSGPGGAGAAGPLPGPAARPPGRLGPARGVRGPGGPGPVPAAAGGHGSPVSPDCGRGALERSSAAASAPGKRPAFKGRRLVFITREYLGMTSSTFPPGPGTRFGGISRPPGLVLSFRHSVGLLFFQSKDRFLNG